MLITTLKWIGKLSFDFPYLVENSSNLRQAKQGKSKYGFSFDKIFFFFPDTVKYSKMPKTIFIIGVFG